MVLCVISVVLCDITYRLVVIQKETQECKNNVSRVIGITKFNRILLRIFAKIQYMFTLMVCCSGGLMNFQEVNCNMLSGDIQFHREPQRDHRGLRAKLFRAFVLVSFHKRDIKLWPTIFKILDKKIFEQDHCLSSGSNPSCKNLNLCGSLCDLCGSP